MQRNVSAMDTCIIPAEEVIYYGVPLSHQPGMFVFKRKSNLFCLSVERTFRIHVVVLETAHFARA